MFNKSQEELRKVCNDADIVIAPFDEEVFNEKAQFFPIHVLAFVNIGRFIFLVPGTYLFLYKNTGNTP